MIDVAHLLRLAVACLGCAAALGLVVAAGLACYWEDQEGPNAAGEMGSHIRE